DVFHTLLGAFHAGHQLILQEGGTLTTLCVVVIAKIRDSNAWVVCACNVGDSLCFIYNKTLGVREVTLGSHDICQMRDMRDAGGALGPVDGVNPELQNLTCSMTFVDDDDLVFITSDGVSDNFDPVVGKFCVIKKSSSPSPANKENSTIQPPAAKEKPTSQGSTKNGHARPKPGAHPERMNSCNSEADDGGFNQKVSVHLPVVDGMQRHDLMLLRMEDMLTHGVTIGDPSACTAKDLCQNLVNFAHQLSMAKRRTLEDPDLYQGEKQLSRSDQRTRRKMVRNKIAEMPGKLDHATVVAYKVGVWPTSEVEDEEEYAQELGGDVTPMPERRQVDSQMTDASTPNGDDAESVQTPVDPPCCETNIDETFVLDSFTVCSAEVTLTDAFSPSKDPYLMAAFAEERVRMIDEMSHSSSITTGEMRMLSLEASPLLDAHPFPVDTVVEPSSTENDQFDEEGTIVPASNGYDSLLPQPDNTTCSQSLTIDDEHTTAPSSEYDIPPIKANNLEPDETITNLAAQLQTVEPDNQFNTDNNMLNRPTQLKIKPGSDVDETDVDEQISWTE
uniref:PPM-type phosphatase domain-containing protein n=1 Tax=Plectus sambesii TaxID=2011161 RepID=A0A914UKV2_9BILA